MTSVNRPTAWRATQAFIALSVLLLALVFASSAFAVNVNLRVEGTAGTFFNGPVTTGPQTVPGGVESPYCHANSTPNVFSGPNTLTALVDALGAPNITSGVAGPYGVQLCSVNGEDTPASGGWLVKINNRSASTPNGFVTATDTLNAGDTALVYRITAFASADPAYTDNSLDLRLPATAAPGQPITAIVDRWADLDDAKTPGSGVVVSGGGASATTGSSGTASLTFATSGKYLVTATKSGSIRGSAYITVDPATPAAPLKRVNRFVKCAKTYKKSSKKYTRCIRIVRAKQAAEAKKK